MAGLIEPNQIGKREDLSTLISVIDNKKLQYSSMVRKDVKPENMLTSWQMDKEKAIDATGQAGIKDGTDVTAFGNPAENRKLASVYGQWFRQADKIGLISETVSNVAGAPSELARGVKRLIRSLKRNIEVKLLSVDETQAEGSGAFELRGLDKWILASANAVLPVDVGFRTPTASIDTTTNTASITEAKIETVQESIWNETGETSDLDVFCGSKFKKRVDALQLAETPQADGTEQIVARHVTKTQADLKQIRKIDIIENSFGTLKLHLSAYLAYADGVRTNAVSNGRAYFVNMKQVRVRFNMAPRMKMLEDAGGGPRYEVSSILSHQMDNPLAHGKFTPTAD